MAIQQMFYESVAPLNSERHKNWHVESGTNYDFASKINFVPLMAVEIPRAAREYTIVFAPSSEEAVIVGALIGVEGQQNLYLKEDGGWDAQYVPAFIRRYPFVFARASEEENKFVLCIDENWSGCNQEGNGQPLFDDNDKPTPFVENVLNFLKDFQRQADLTQTYCSRLKELELLDHKQLQFTLADGQQRSVKGFMAVDREKLKNLPPEKLAEMVKSNELELTYAHILSMNNISLVIERSAAHHAKKGESPEKSPEKSPEESPEKGPEESPKEGQE